ncbi:UDP-N-acetylglucosamine 1-carboxyvinyltransferase [Rhodovulum sulfidophilum]|uniref:UDP-N-acetylglucosamine 1-carboxyvinyltransferase n=1 Tax=Rhodovulum sulfidophilum TaxID=35806 RepID=UPI0005AB3849|nr:UDP-N-acetylglucosamine 1-carboxyvinyltransferase [Rhodovulum sulfidophilum]ANB34407.1 UDP-N-acetylglucosamine 1-carboxyvinyltransferase [Rhodovulum sulfidophilum DSM 1374]ANB38230.1 UDP-N-acetylglucosamine 1-carboxyvinyltransferase [Rhodovulum sulfidophilum]MCW2305456.1 UDP-N-acetylglucosamine 1-carboxyvinyltransferase [Rhodovulum sulfidophilum]
MRLFLGDRTSLNGTVNVSGAKNSATRVLAAALLSDQPVTLRNFPLELEDVKAKLSFIRAMGAELTPSPEQEELRIHAQNLSFDDISDFNLPIRTTYLLAGGALARHGTARVPYPGGCKIGSRGYDLHIMVWKALGCEVEELPDYINVTGKLRGGEIDFPISTVGGTENALICASVASGETQIRNAYVTPEVRDLIAFLREMGAKIELEGSSHINVTGNGGVLGNATFSIMADRIEALTWLVLGAVSGGRLAIQNVPLDTMQVPLIHLRDAGLDFFTNSNSVQVGPDCIGPQGLQPFELATGTHPGVISDMQSFYVFLALFANGRSIIHDYRYPERIAYVAELAKFAPGALEAERGKITVRGPVKLVGAHAASTDLRGSMAQIMAALCAEGPSTVDAVEMALRGYNRLPEKLRSLGAQAEWTD